MLGFDIMRFKIKNVQSYERKERFRFQIRICVVLGLNLENDGRRRREWWKKEKKPISVISKKKFPYMCAMCALTNGQLTERTMGSNGGVHVGPN